MVTEEIIYEDDKIKAYIEVPQKDDGRETRQHHCACGHTVCCGKHKNCPKSKNWIRFKGERD